MLLDNINCNKSMRSQKVVLIFIAHARCLICQSTASLFLGSQIVVKTRKQKILMLSTANDPQYDQVKWSPPGEEPGVLPYMGYIDLCRCEGYGFQAVYTGIGYTNENIWV